MSIIVSTQDSFFEEIKSGYALVDFYADWCGPCQALAPILEAVDSEGSAAKIVKLNVDNAQEVASKYGVMSIPTMILFKDGQKVDQKVGVLQKEDLVTWINVNK